MQFDEGTCPRCGHSVLNWDITCPGCDKVPRETDEGRKIEAHIRLKRVLFHELPAIAVVVGMVIWLVLWFMPTLKGHR